MNIQSETITITFIFYPDMQGEIVKELSNFFEIFPIFRSTKISLQDITCIEQEYREYINYLHKLKSFMTSQRPQVKYVDVTQTFFTSQLTNTNDMIAKLSEQLKAISNIRNWMILYIIDELRP